MYALFYILGYIAFLGFICLSVLKIMDYYKASPLHVRWEIYPIPHEGPKKYAYGGSYMEEKNWWTKPYHVDHLMDIKVMLQEIFFLHSTFEHNRALWVRSYPFHMGLYMAMGGTFISIFAAILRLCGVKASNGFMLLLANAVNAMALFGSLAIMIGGTLLIIYRKTNKDMAKYTTKQMIFNLASFVVFAFFTFAAWIFNPSFAELCREYFYNLFTFTLASPHSVWFTLAILAGYVVMIWIPITNESHILMKYFLYHNIMWGDKATVWSKKNQDTIPELLEEPVTWSAWHLTGEGEKDWGQVATTNPAVAPKDNK